MMWKAVSGPKVYEFVLHTTKPRSWEMEPTPKPPFLIGSTSPTAEHDTLCPRLRFATTSFLRLEGPIASIGPACLLWPLCHHPHYTPSEGGHEIHLFPPNLNPSEIPTLNQTSISLEP